MKYVLVCFMLTSALFAQVDMQGTVKAVTDHDIAVELKDTRVVTFKVNSATKFGGGASLKSLKQGDHVLIQGALDSDAFLVATVISPEGAPLPAPDAPPPTSAPRASAPPRSEPARTVSREDSRTSPPPSNRDPDAPVLRRGKPAQQSTASSDDAPPTSVAAARPAPPDDMPADSSLRGVRDRPADVDYSRSEGRMIPVSRPTNLGPHEELLERAREWALGFTDNLPNFLCQQYTTRYIRQPGSREWHAQDVVSANVVYENGKEDYRNVAINGKPVNKKMEELPGSWSTGEFGTTLISLFHPGRQAEFTYVKQANVSGVTTSVYDYKVRKENSDWHISLGSQSIVPSYAGRVWIEEKTAEVMRIEMSATNIPSDFALDQVEAASDYGFVRLATSDQYMLPTHAETLSCERGTPFCSRNTIDFRNYHKYTGEANIIFDK